MYILTFTKTFIRGILKGIEIEEELSFVSPKRAQVWVDTIIRDKELPFRISNFTQKETNHALDIRFSNKG